MFGDVCGNPPCGNCLGEFVVTTLQLGRSETQASRDNDDPKHLHQRGVAGGRFPAGEGTSVMCVSSAVARACQGFHDGNGLRGSVSRSNHTGVAEQQNR